MEPKLTKLFAFSVCLHGRHAQKDGELCTFYHGRDRLQAPGRNSVAGYQRFLVPLLHVQGEVPLFNQLKSRCRMNTFRKLFESRYLVCRKINFPESSRRHEPFDVSFCGFKFLIHFSQSLEFIKAKKVNRREKSC